MPKRGRSVLAFSAVISMLIFSAYPMEGGHLRARARLKNVVTEVRKADMPNYPLTNK